MTSYSAPGTAPLSSVNAGWADGAGWDSFAAVRAYPMMQDPDGLNANGGPPVGTSKACEGAIQ
jgi:hypothetical protein